LLCIPVNYLIRQIRENEQKMSEDKKIVILVTNLGRVNNSKVPEDNRRTAISRFFEKDLTKEPLFVFAQEIQNSQIDKVKESLEKRSGPPYAHCQVKEYGSSHNAIIWKDGQTVTEHKDVWQKNGVQLGSCDEFQISSKRFRFTVLTRGERSVLLVNYHGERNGMAEKERVQNFLVYLKLFQGVKMERDCNYLVIGGDFNFDLDTFAENNQTFLDNNYNLKVVPYQSEIKRKTKKNILNIKVDGLMCDKEMWIEDENVVVFQRQAAILGGRSAQRYADTDDDYSDDEEDNYPFQRQASTIEGGTSEQPGSEHYDYTDDDYSENEEDDPAGASTTTSITSTTTPTTTTTTTTTTTSITSTTTPTTSTTTPTTTLTSTAGTSAFGGRCTTTTRIPPTTTRIPQTVLGHDPILFTLRLPKKQTVWGMKDFLVFEGILEPRFLEKRKAINVPKAARFLFNADIFEEILKCQDNFSLVMEKNENAEELEESRKIYEEQLKKILVNLPEYSEEERKRLAMITAHWFTTKQLSATVLGVLFGGQVNPPKPIKTEFELF
jgi:hypothetical protein